MTSTSTIRHFEDIHDVLSNIPEDEFDVSELRDMLRKPNRMRTKLLLKQRPQDFDD